MDNVKPHILYSSYLLGSCTAGSIYCWIALAIYKDTRLPILENPPLFAALHFHIYSFIGWNDNPVKQHTMVTYSSSYVCFPLSLWSALLFV